MYPARGTVPKRTALCTHTMRAHTHYTLHTHCTLHHPQHTAPCTHTLSMQHLLYTLTDTICTASPIYTFCLGYLAHARRACSTSRTLNTPYIHTDSTCSTFPPRVHIWHLSCTYIHTHYTCTQHKAPCTHICTPPIHRLSRSRTLAYSRSPARSPSHIRNTPSNTPWGRQGPGIPRVSGSVHPTRWWQARAGV